MDGNYTITVPDDPNTTLLVSFVGMKPEAENWQIDGAEFHPRRDATVLDQVVVNGVFERKANPTPVR
ncbi:MAG: hypothetical protein ACLUOS_16000 [Odoribacter splanchnicus]